MLGSPSGLIGGKIDTIVATLRRSHFAESLTDDDLQRVAAYMVFQSLYTEVPSLGKSLIRSLDADFGSNALAARRGRNLRVVGILGSDSRPHSLVQPLLAALTSRGQRLAHIGRDPETVRAIACRTEPLVNSRGDLRPVEELSERITHLLKGHHRVIVDLTGDFPADGVAGILSVCEEIFGLIDSGCQQRSQRVLRDLLTSSPELSSRLRTIWVLRPPQLVTPSSQVSWENGNRNFVVQLAESPERPTRLQQQGIDRIVRHISGIRLGLALGGGAARGMAHFGVLRAFNRAGIGFDMVAGTSAGAMVGIPYAAGYDPELAIERYAADLTPPRLYRLLPGGLQWYLMIKYRTDAWDRMLRRYFFDWRLEQLQVPMFTVAVDLVSGSQIVRDSGDAVHALAESINLPILARPICRDGMALVDGGVLNTLPTKVLADRGADLVVGVSVSGKIRREFCGNQADTEIAVMQRPGTLQTLRRVLEMQDHALKRIDAQAADLLIEPDATSFDMADFSRTAEIAAAGEAAAELAIGDLKSRIAELERRAMQEVEVVREVPTSS